MRSLSARHLTQQSGLHVLASRFTDHKYSHNHLVDPSQICTTIITCANIYSFLWSQVTSSLDWLSAYCRPIDENDELKRPPPMPILPLHFFTTASYHARHIDHSSRLCSSQNHRPKHLSPPTDLLVALLSFCMKFPRDPTPDHVSEPLTKSPLTTLSLTHGPTN